MEIGISGRLRLGPTSLLRRVSSAGRISVLELPPDLARLPDACMTVSSIASSAGRQRVLEDPRLAQALRCKSGSRFRSRSLVTVVTPPRKRGSTHAPCLIGEPVVALRRRIGDHSIKVGRCGQHPPRLFPVEPGGHYALSDSFIMRSNWSAARSIAAMPCIRCAKVYAARPI